MSVAPGRGILRGEVWWADLPVPAGAEPGYRRPVMIVSADLFNRKPLATAMVVACTSNPRHALFPGNVPIPAGVLRLPQVTVASVTQLLTIDRVLLEDRIGSLPPPLMKQIDDGLKLALGL